MLETRVSSEALGAGQSATQFWSLCIISSAPQFSALGSRPRRYSYRALATLLCQKRVIAQSCKNWIFTVIFPSRQLWPFCSPNVCSDVAQISSTVSYMQNEIYFICKGKHCLCPEKTTEKWQKINTGNHRQIIYSKTVKAKWGPTLLL